MKTNPDIRPFNAHDAHNGAPYATRSGASAKVLLWTGRDPLFPIVGVRGDEDRPTRWRADGGYGATMGMALGEDLVMTPLGMVEGKPFFCGDIICGIGGGKFRAEPHDQNGLMDQWKWPAPEYPVSTISEKALHSAWYSDPAYHPPFFDLHTARVCADAGLRHALETGQVVLPMA